MPLPKIDLAPRAAVGLAIGTNRVCVVRLTSDRDAWSLNWSRCETLDAPLFRGMPSAETVAALEKAISAVAEGVNREYIPVHVALPDPLAAASVFELDALPKTREAQLNLVNWRLAKEHYGDDRALACACQPLGEQGGKRLLFGMALETPWKNAVDGVLQRTGIVPWTMNIATCYRFNLFHPLMTADGRGGAMVALDPDAWALALWDTGGRLRWLRGRWRDGLPQGDGACDAIAVDAERFILAYVHGGADRRVERVYVAGGDETTALTAALDRRLRERSIPLTADGGTTAARDNNKAGDGLRDAALAAATGQ